jgi:hypothetical protein
MRRLTGTDHLHDACYVNVPCINRSCSHPRRVLTGTFEALEYGRQEVRCTVEILNILKEEFDKHPIKLHPDKAVSPASIGKAYLRYMGIVPLMQKFRIPDYFHGIASQAYFGGRAESGIRNTPFPVVLTDFSSQYPTWLPLFTIWLGAYFYPAMFSPRECLTHISRLP